MHGCIHNIHSSKSHLCCRGSDCRWHVLGQWQSVFFRNQSAARPKSEALCRRIVGSCTRWLYIVLVVTPNVFHIGHGFVMFSINQVILYVLGAHISEHVLCTRSCTYIVVMVTHCFLHKHDKWFTKCLVTFYPRLLANVFRNQLFTQCRDNTMF